ncbi:hypothetical protein SMGD1_0687 [Sulfurimonas gotlandica GD1]|uniref:Uncharacterized protein n=1 Tax=Sulfurimonas gotlandica (strain DSM 19862 / JCM 16533 / GD1) TaxID=929558 RepID=B6BP07_SULGG|nr:hypothetical protein [Sulfurimonas gotlandica]EDZ61174.1 hypothetical protein CBGD1_1531 [Sulfurimonas gotlandica GD1]EHP29214.1 hypothetical protein SMGD1_0687 [Sulfurimonas gotlandica GD1]
MLPSKRLQEIIGEELVIDFLRASKVSNAEQVAFGTVDGKNSIPSCKKWWEKNKKEFTKKLFFSNNALTLNAG